VFFQNSKSKSQISLLKIFQLLGMKVGAENN